MTKKKASIADDLSAEKPRRAAFRFELADEHLDEVRACYEINKTGEHWIATPRIARALKAKYDLRVHVQTIERKVRAALAEMEASDNVEA